MIANKCFLRSTFIEPTPHDPKKDLANAIDTLLHSRNIGDGTGHSSFLAGLHFIREYNFFLTNPFSLIEIPYSTHQKNTGHLPMVIQFSETTDESLINGYIALRSQVFSNDYGVDFYNGRDEYDDRSIFVIGHDESGKVVGGRRIMIREPQENFQLIFEKKMGITYADLFPHLNLSWFRLAEVGGLCLAPSIRQDTSNSWSPHNLRRIYKATLTAARAHHIPIMVASSFYGNAALTDRLYKRMCRTGVPVNYAIRSDINGEGHDFGENCKNLPLIIVASSHLPEEALNLIPPTVTREALDHGFLQRMKSYRFGQKKNKARLHRRNQVPMMPSCS